MRWKHKKKEWKEGDSRKRFPFAFLPTRVGEHMIWLETYVVYEQLKVVAKFDEGGFVYPELQWVEISREVRDYY